jgi:hypothetical protein
MAMASLKQSIKAQISEMYFSIILRNQIAVEKEVETYYIYI